MPSLRRSLPASRSAPYPAARSSAGRMLVPRPRRTVSSAQTSRRRVLGDIEWWRVLDGQSEDDDTDADRLHPVDVDAVSSVLLHMQGSFRADASAGRADISALTGHPHSHLESCQSATLPIPVSAFSIAPVAPSTPTGTHARLHDSRETTPEALHHSHCTDSSLVLTHLENLDIFVRPRSPAEELGLKWHSSRSRRTSLNSRNGSRSSSCAGFHKHKHSRDENSEDIPVV